MCGMWGLFVQQNTHTADLSLSYAGELPFYKKVFDRVKWIEKTVTKISNTVTEDNELQTHCFAVISSENIALSEITFSHNTYLSESSMYSRNPSRKLSSTCKQIREEHKHLKNRMENTSEDCINPMKKHRDKMVRMEKEDWKIAEVTQSGSIKQNGERVTAHRPHSTLGKFCKMFQRIHSSSVLTAATFISDRQKNKQNKTKRTPSSSLNFGDGSHINHEDVQIHE